MINIHNLDKTYYKGKSNEIHVIHDTSLSLPDTGLVCFLGASGSGKTTLLNTIGGLDKADKGSIAYGDEQFNRYKMDQVDAFRSKNIGYVFQNYLLLEQYSIQENLRIALELIGITDPEEVKKRIEYVLKAVGLYRFRKKPAGQLSGGQQQRVSIARALIKKTKIIIADEPTGNLDSENTIDVMNILKKISKEALVLVVTHNNEIAEFYADRIVRLKDGKVESDLENVSSGSLESQNDNKIHLLDLENQSVDEGVFHLDLFNDDQSTKQKVTIVLKNNTIYIDTDARVQLVSGSSVSLVNDHYKKLEASEVEDFNFDTAWYNDTVSHTTIGAFFRGIGAAFKHFYFDPKRRKLFNLTFALIGTAIAILVLFQTNYTNVDLSSISNEPDMYTISKEDDLYYDRYVSSDLVLQAVDLGYLDDFQDYGRKVTFKAKMNSRNGIQVTSKGSSYPIEYIQDRPLLEGRFPVTPNEIVIGKETADEILAEFGGKSDYKSLMGMITDMKNTVVGVSSANTNSIYYVNYVSVSYGTKYDSTKEDNIEFRSKYTFDEGDIVEGRDIVAENEVLVSTSSYGFVGDELQIDNKAYTIVGKYISRTTAEVLTKSKELLAYTYYTDNNCFVRKSVATASYEVTAFPNTFFKYTIAEGRDIESPLECVASVYSGSQIGDYIQGLKVVGRFETEKDTFEFNTTYGISSLSTRDVLLTTRYGCARVSLLMDNYISYSRSFHITDEAKARALFEGKGYQVNLTYDEEVSWRVRNSNESKKIYPIIEAVLLGIILVYTYFSERAKMISEVYDIGVLRSLGAKRKRIICKSMLDNFAKITLTTLFGYIITIVIYVFVANKVNHLTSRTLLSTNPLYMLLGVLVLYGTQLLIGVLPYVMLLHKTPSEINSKYDI